MDTTKIYRQSVEFASEEEQSYYNQARLMMKENGFSSMKSFIDNEVKNIPEESLLIDKNRFIEILKLSEKDYLKILYKKL